MCWRASPRMLSSCDHWSRPGHLFWSDQWAPLCVLAWVLCVCTCACVHSCLKLGVTAQPCCSTWSSASSDCILHLDLNFILVNKQNQTDRNKVAGSTGWDAFLWKNVCSDGPWDVSTDFIWDFFWKESLLSVGQTSTRKRGEPNASMPSASAYSCAPCVVQVARLQLN